MDEYISREETVKAFCEKCKGYYDGHCIHRGECDVDVIKTAPAADVQPVDRWISVKERFPDEDGWYLVCKHNRVRVAEWCKDCWYNESDLPIDDCTITYWKPLPEPPKDGDTNG